MNTITNLYISKVEKKITAEFISNIFEKNGIAKVSKILLENRKNNEKYNRAFIEIKDWCDTEMAFNFIMRLRNPIREARIVYSEDNWWSVEINRFPHTISKMCENCRVLTVFRDNYSFDDFDDDDVSTSAVIYPEPTIDYEKTRQLKALIYGYKDADEMEEAEQFDGYLHEAYQSVNNWVNSDEFIEVSI
jgi:hypothetical protein